MASHFAAFGGTHKLSGFGDPRLPQLCFANTGGRPDQYFVVNSVSVSELRRLSAVGANSTALGTHAYIIVGRSMSEPNMRTKRPFF